MCRTFGTNETIIVASTHNYKRITTTYISNNVTLHNTTEGSHATVMCYLTSYLVVITTESGDTQLYLYKGVVLLDSETIENAGNYKLVQNKAIQAVVFPYSQGTFNYYVYNNTIDSGEGKKGQWKKWENKGKSGDDGSGGKSSNVKTILAIVFCLIGLVVIIIVVVVIYFKYCKKDEREYAMEEQSGDGQQPAQSVSAAAYPVENPVGQANPDNPADKYVVAVDPRDSTFNT